MNFLSLLLFALAFTSYAAEEATGACKTDADCKDQVCIKGDGAECTCEEAGDNQTACSGNGKDGDETGSTDVSGADETQTDDEGQVIGEEIPPETENGNDTQGGNGFDVDGKRDNRSTDDVGNQQIEAKQMPGGKDGSEGRQDDASRDFSPDLTIGGVGTAVFAVYFLLLPILCCIGFLVGAFVAIEFLVRKT